jgi:hypothetical protein
VHSPQLRTTAHCLRCPWTAAGGTADKAAEKHTGVGHPTATVTEAV